MPLLVVGIFLSFVFTFSLLAFNAKLLYLDYTKDQVEEGVVTIRNALESYYLEKGLWPSSLEAMANEPSYFYLKKYIPVSAGGTHRGASSPWKIHFSVEKTDSAGGYRYRDVAISGFISRNNSSTNFSDGAICPSPEGLKRAGIPFESSCQGNKAIVAFVSSLNLKFNLDEKAYKQQAYAGKKLTALKRAGQTLVVVPNYTSLRSLVTASAGSSVGTSAATCLGTFHWQGAGFECLDLYNLFGNVVEIQVPNQTSVNLRSASNFVNPLGAPFILNTTIVH